MSKGNKTSTSAACCSSDRGSRNNENLLVYTGI